MHHFKQIDLVVERPGPASALGDLSLSILGGLLACDRSHSLKLVFNGSTLLLHGLVHLGKA